jgi:hypothetical protein
MGNIIEQICNFINEITRNNYDWGKWPWEVPKWPWDVPKWPWFRAGVAVKACRDLATLSTDHKINFVILFIAKIIRVLLSTLKGLDTKFFTSVFFHQTIPPRPLIHGLKPCWIRLRICGVNRQSWLHTQRCPLWHAQQSHWHRCATNFVENFHEWS